MKKAEEEVKRILPAEDKEKRTMTRSALIPKDFLSQGDCPKCGGYTTHDGTCPRCRAREMRLLPCPFCGGEAAMKSWHGGAPTKVLISCDNDECEVSPEVSGETPEEAKKTWERRDTSVVFGWV